MYLNEFRAWLDGFEEAIDGSPTPKQWKKIQKKLKETHDCQPSYPHPIYHYPHYYTVPDFTLTTSNPNIRTVTTDAISIMAIEDESGGNDFDYKAHYVVGQADAAFYSKGPKKKISSVETLSSTFEN